MKSKLCGGKITIVEYDHAILVSGTYSILEAREALKRDGWSKAYRRLPCRPFWDPDLGGHCVGFYFHYGEFCPPSCKGCALNDQQSS